MSESELQPVTKEFFDRCCAEYPRTLTRDITGISDPPCLCVYDFSLGKVPENMLGLVRLNHDRDGSPNEYFWRFTLVTNGFLKAPMSSEDIVINVAPMGITGTLEELNYEPEKK